MDISALRRLEAERLVMNATTLSHHDANNLVGKLIEIVFDTPAVVLHCAWQLGNWNHEHSTPKFIMQMPMPEDQDPNEVIAEIVLDAAAHFRGDTAEPVPPKSLVHVPLTFDDLIHRVTKAREFIDTYIGSSKANDEVTSLSTVIDTLIKLKSNYLLVPKDE